MRSIWQMIKKEGPGVVHPHTDKLIRLLVRQVCALFQCLRVLDQGCCLRSNLRLSHTNEARGSDYDSASMLSISCLKCFKIREWRRSVNGFVVRCSTMLKEMHVTTHEALSRELLGHLVDIGSLTQSYVRPTPRLDPHPFTSYREAGRHVVKSLNILMLKVRAHVAAPPQREDIVRQVLENADRTSSFHVLLKFLTMEGTGCRMAAVGD